MSNTAKIYQLVSFTAHANAVLGDLAFQLHQCGFQNDAQAINKWMDDYIDDLITRLGKQIEKETITESL